MIKTDIFISRPTWIEEKYSEGLQNFLSVIESYGLEHHTLGTTTYPVGNPLDHVIKLMRRCKGAIVLGYPQIYANELTIKGVPQKGEFYFPTEWNHVEGAIAHSLGLPVLLIYQKGLIKRGIFDPTSFPVFPYDLELSDPNWVYEKKILGALKEYFDSLGSSADEGSLTSLLTNEICPNHVAKFYLRKLTIEQKINHPTASLYCPHCQSFS